MLRFKVELETATPVHIGCGEEYYPTEYVVDDKEKKLFVVDENKLLNTVEQKGKLEEFTHLASSYTQKNSALLDFIKSFSLGSYRYSANIEPAAFKYITKQTMAFRAGISRFIRNKYDDRVYIPGSTVKGALRSATIDFIMRRIEKRFEDKIDKEKFDRKTLLERLRLDCNKLDRLLVSEEEGSFAHRDIMRYVKVSDFLPVGNISQTVYRVFAVGKPKQITGKWPVREIKNIPDILECVDRRSKFEGEIQVQKKFIEKLNEILKKLSLKELNSFSEKTIATWMRFVYVNKVYLWEDKYFAFSLDTQITGGEKYHEIYMNNFKKFALSSLNKEKGEFYVKFGKHGGAVSKTIDGCREIEIKVGRNSITSDHQSTLWVAGGYPMGWLKGQIKQI